MTIADREKKLKYAEMRLKMTLTRIKRLQTAAEKWQTRATYQSRELALQRAENMVTQGHGRMFRRVS